MSYVVNLVLEGRVAVVVGGGPIAFRKAEDLVAAKAIVNVVATEPCGDMRALEESGCIVGIWRSYRKTDLYGAFLVIAATNDKAVNARVHRDAQSLGVLVNVVDDPPLCTFTVPATVRRGRLTLAVATDGSCPAFAGVLREELEAKYGPEYRDLVELMGDLRRQMVARRWDGDRIRRTIRELYHDGVVEALAMNDRQLVRKFVRAHLGPEFEV